MFVKALLCSILLSSCSSDIDTIVEEFYTQAAARNCFPKRMPMAFADLQGSIVGLCVPFVSMFIDSKSFDRFGYYERREVIFHELGHCVLYRDHTDDEKSLMTPKMHDELALVGNFDRMVDELFSDCSYSRGPQ